MKCHGALVVGLVLALAGGAWADSIVPITLDWSGTYWMAAESTWLGGTPIPQTYTGSVSNYWLGSAAVSSVHLPDYPYSKDIGEASNLTHTVKVDMGTQPGMYGNTYISTEYYTKLYVSGGEIFGDSVTEMTGILGVGTTGLYAAGTPLQLNVATANEGGTGWGLTLTAGGEIMAVLGAGHPSISINVRAGDVLGFEYESYTNWGFAASDRTMPITGDTGYDMSLIISFSATTPEPGTLVLLALGGVATLLRRRRRIA